MGEETWASIEGSKYEISNWGDVRVRLKSGQTKPHRIQERQGTGHQYVTMIVNGKNVERSVADLVREYFGE